MMLSENQAQKKRNTSQNVEFATSPSAEQAIINEKKTKKNKQLVNRDVTGQVQQNFPHWGHHWCENKTDFMST